MIKDFANRSLNMSEESPGMKDEGAANDEDEATDDVIERHQMRRTWESRLFLIVLFIHACELPKMHRSKIIIIINHC